MIQAVSVSEINSHLEKTIGRPRGLVPTMGALHPGHLSLIKEAIKECPVIVVSIFVNPTQFNDKADLVNYPRTPAKDLDLLLKSLRENDIVFTPGVRDIYPEEDKRIFDFGGLDKVMEGLHRPGHFNGVAQIVTRLFDIVEPDIAFFGQKDFQQLTIIKNLVRKTGRSVKITDCPIVRENNGLAMSSRNTLLEPAIRERAGIIFKTLRAASALTDEKSIAEIKEFASDSINKTEGFSIDYFEIVDDTNLKPVNSANEIRKGARYYGCIAVRAGNIRLIDNYEFSFPVKKG
jgi:pantoate--beta-alanine ligase